MINDHSKQTNPFNTNIRKLKLHNRENILTKSPF